MQEERKLFNVVHFEGGRVCRKEVFFLFFGNRNKFEFESPPPTLEMKVERDRILVGQS